MWIESDQKLRAHPKVRRAARMLDVHQAQVIGHLHCLWWWALDHALDGDVSAFDALDLAEAADWPGDPDTFVKVLLECGPGDRAGFLEARGDRLYLDDWAHRTEHLRRRREASAAAHHARWHEARGIVEPGCDLCEPDANAVRTHPDRTAEPLPEQCTEPNRTQPHHTDPTPSSTDVDQDEPEDDRFEEFWEAWPRRNGKKLAKGKARQQWRTKVAPDERERAIRGAHHYRQTSDAGLAGAMDAFRWLRDRSWPDWQEPASPNGSSPAHSTPPDYSDHTPLT